MSSNGIGLHNNINLTMNGQTFAKLCRCLLDCFDEKENSTCILQPNAKCYRKLAWDAEEDMIIETAGCLGSTDLYIDQCNEQSHPDFYDQTDIQCCDDSDLCNDRLIMKLPPTTEPPPEATLDGTTLLALIVTISVAFIICVVFVGAFCLRFKRQEKKRRKQIDEEKNDSFGLPGRKNKLNDLLRETCSSGSGVPLLVQRTIARQIDIISELGKGRYGKVMLGKWREEKVAVKIFNTIDEDSWFRETEIYQTVLLRHENILCFIASDINGTGSWTQLYLITDYHCNGSLYDFLNTHQLTVSEAVTLAHTAACGLAHLHIEIVGTQGKAGLHTVQDVNGKPAIAHRDIKSKNILVKKDRTCCIADMGLAVKYNSALGKVEKGNYETSCRQGTVRYMSPELLNGKFIGDSFDAYKSSDVYSFSLVMWEIINCIKVASCRGYLLPYHDCVGNDPDYDEMRKAIHVNGIRPEIPRTIADHPLLNCYTETMHECWLGRPESRLTMLRVRKTLAALNDEISGNVSEKSKAGDPYTNHYIYSNNSSVNKEMYNPTIPANTFIPPQHNVVHSGINGQISNSPNNFYPAYPVYQSDESASPLINDDSASSSLPPNESAK